MGMCSSAARAVGAPKRRQAPREAHSDSDCRVLPSGTPTGGLPPPPPRAPAPPPPPAGASPLRPGKNQNKTFLRRKNKKIPAPSRWSGRSTVGQKKNEEKLA